MQKFAAAIMLTVGALAEVKRYSGGEISTKESFLYGRFVANVLPSSLKGTWTSFYLMGYDFSENLDVIWDEWSAIHYVPHSPAPFITKGSSFMNNSWEAERDPEDHGRYHRFEIEWIPYKMTFKIDDIPVRTIQGAEVQNLQEPQNLALALFTKDFSVENGHMENWQGGLTSTEIYNVEVYNYNESTKEFNLRWNEDFSAFNDQRWKLGYEEKTWDGLNSTFLESNARFEDDKLILDLKDEHYVVPEDSSDGNESDEEPEHSGDESHEGSDDESDEGSDDEYHHGSDDEAHHSGSDDEAHHSGSDDESHHGSDDESHHGSDDESHHGSDHDSDHSDDDSHHSGDDSHHSGDDSHEDSDEEPEFHVLHPPKSGSLDMAIEKATRAGVSMVRMQLDNFSESMAHFLQ